VSDDDLAERVMENEALRRRHAYGDGAARKRKPKPEGHPAGQALEPDKRTAEARHTMSLYVCDSISAVLPYNAPVMVKYRKKKSDEKRTPTKRFTESQ